MTVWPRGATRPTASNLNFSAGETFPNLVIVPLGLAGSVSVYNDTGAAQVLVDVLGYFPTAPALTTPVFTGITPQRFMDTRRAATIDNQFSGAGPLGANTFTSGTSASPAITNVMRLSVRSMARFHHTPATRARCFPHARRR